MQVAAAAATMGEVAAAAIGAAQQHLHTLRHWRVTMQRVVAQQMQTCPLVRER